MRGRPGVGGKSQRALRRRRSAAEAGKLSVRLALLVTALAAVLIVVIGTSRERMLSAPPVAALPHSAPVGVQPEAEVAVARLQLEPLPVRRLGPERLSGLRLEPDAGRELEAAEAGAPLLVLDPGGALEDLQFRRALLAFKAQLALSPGPRVGPAALAAQEPRIRALLGELGRFPLKEDVMNRIALHLQGAS